MDAHDRNNLVVALESTIIMHGLPIPDGVGMALMISNARLAADITVAFQC